MKRRAKALVQWLVSNGAAPDASEPATAANCAGDSVTVAVAKDDRTTWSNTTDVAKALSTIPAIPTACQRAPAEVARAQRMGRKCWNSSTAGVRCETPLFAEWSPVDSVHLTDRSVPSYPRTIRVVAHDHKAPRSTVHKGSAKQQLLNGHYAKPPSAPAPNRRREKASGVKSRRKLKIAS